MGYGCGLTKRQREQNLLDRLVACQLSGLKGGISLSGKVTHRKIRWCFLKFLLIEDTLGTKSYCSAEFPVTPSLAPERRPRALRPRTSNLGLHCLGGERAPQKKHETNPTTRCRARVSQYSEAFQLFRIRFRFCFGFPVRGPGSFPPSASFWVMR